MFPLSLTLSHQGRGDVTEIAASASGLLAIVDVT